jgi:tetratricopeptide (TPR) repeat protein
MHTRSRLPVHLAPWLLAVGALSLGAACSDSQAESHGEKPATTAARGTPLAPDVDLAPYQAELLELAYASASAFPLNPHVKNRSRAQEAVVAACLELDQPQRALRYSEGIANWRRGKCLADIAYHLAQRDPKADVQKYLDQAEKIAGDAPRDDGNAPSDSVEGSQEWRRDRVRAAIARTYILLGQEERAARVGLGVVDSEVGAIHGEKAEHGAPETFEEQIRALDTLVATGSFDPQRAALDSYVRLFDRHYGDVPRRQIVEEKIPLAWAKLPLDVRIRTELQLAGHAIAHQDSPKALTILDETQLMLDGVKWDAEFHVPLVAKLAATRFRAGDRERARSQADAALAAYEEGRAGIVNMYRAGVLRPLAEAYKEMGDVAKAREVYAKAFEEGVLNPNSRPRAEDLVATATSMAVRGVEPDAALGARMKEIRSKLGDPW